MTKADSELQTVHLTTEQLAQRLNLEPKTIYNRRSRGGSLPASIDIGGRVRWRLSDVIAWENAHLVEARTPSK